MKVVRNTPEQLILSSVPWFIALVLSGCVLLSVGFGLEALFRDDYAEAFWGMIGIPAFLSIFLVTFARRDDVILDNTRSTVEMRHATFLGRKTVKHALMHLERAIVQTSHSDGSDTHRVALVLSGGMDLGTHPVTEVYASGSAAARAAETINNWLRQNVDTRRQQA